MPDYDDATQLLIAGTCDLWIAVKFYSFLSGMLSLSTESVGLGLGALNALAASTLGNCDHNGSLLSLPLFTKDVLIRFKFVTTHLLSHH